MHVDSNLVPCLAKRIRQTSRDEPPKIRHNLRSSVALVIHSLTVYWTFSDLSSLWRTPRIARSALSPAIESVRSDPASVAVVATRTSWARLSLKGFAVLNPKQSRSCTFPTCYRTHQECKGSCLKTCKTVSTTSDRFRRTLNVSSAHRRNTPSVPDMPKPSTMSSVRRKGTSSGIGRS
jgi:hypothetical protein